jgi:FkbM family methyltransferase
MKLLSSIRKRFHPLYRLRRLSWFRAIQSNLDPDVWIPMPVGGGRYRVKLMRDLSLILPHDGKEEKTRRRFDQLLRIQTPEVFFDIGANVGIYSWHARSRGVPKIFLFEPDLVNARLMAQTIKANHFVSVYLIPCAVSNRFGAAKFIVDQGSGATGSLLDHSDNASSLHSAYGMRSVSVPTICLDAYTDYCCGKKVLVKIDVVGAEGQVMEGGERFFAEIKPFIIIECFEPERLLWFQEAGLNRSKKMAMSCSCQLRSEYFK